MKHQGNEPLMNCTLHQDPLSKEAEGRSPSKSVFLFKTLHWNYRSKCAEFVMGLFWTCVNIYLCSTWRLAPGKGLNGRLSFWQWKQIRFLPNCPFHANKICYGVWGQWVLLRFCSLFGPPSKGLCAIYPQPRLFLKNLTVRNLLTVNAETAMGDLYHV